MKTQFKLFSKNAALLSLVTSMALTGGAGSVLAVETISNSQRQSSEIQPSEQETKYSKRVMYVLRENLGANAKSTEIDSRIAVMPKVEVMDSYLASFGKKVKGNEVRRVIKEIFDIDLSLTSKNNYGTKVAAYPENVMQSLRASYNEASDSTEQDARIMELSKNAAMDRYIKEHGYKLDGSQTRLLINQIYGVNLDGISKLEHMQLGILSKGQWIVKSDTDLIVLESSLDDVEVSIYTTPYFEQMTGGSELPESLKQKLAALGFVYLEDANIMYYKNPTSESVSDLFKNRVVGAIAGTIIQEYKR